MTFDTFAAFEIPGTIESKQKDLPVTNRGRLKPPNRRKKPGLTPDAIYRKTPEMPIELTSTTILLFHLIYNAYSGSNIDSNIQSRRKDCATQISRLTYHGPQPVGPRLFPAQFGLDSPKEGNT